MMRSTFFKAIILLAIASATAVAQRRTPPDPGQMVQHRVEFLTKHLSLNEQQQQQATTIFTEAANGAKTFRDQMRSAHQNLQAAIEKNDTAGIEQNSNTIGNLTAQMMAAHAKADAAFYQILNSEQQSKMKEMDGHFGRGMRGPGHGGPPPGAFFRKP